MLFILIGVVVASVCALVGFCIYRRRKMQRMIEESKNKEMRQRETRYETFHAMSIDDVASSPNDKNENRNGDFVMPGTNSPTDKKEADGKANLLSASLP